MNNDTERVAQGIIEAISIYVNENIKDLKYSKDYRGKVVSIDGDTCDVEIFGEITQCKIRNNLQINVGDVVIVRSIDNNFSDKFVDAKLGMIGDGSSDSVSWANWKNNSKCYHEGNSPPSDTETRLWLDTSI